MQTFLPLPDYLDSARCLDDSRLGNQCYRECVTLFNGGWANHPASKMWVGYRKALARYGLALTVVMLERPKFKRCAAKWFKWWENQHDILNETGDPPWLGDLDFHRSHQSNLLRKDPVWYGQFNWNVPDNLPYIWPVGDTNAS